MTTNVEINAFDAVRAFTRPLLLELDLVAGHAENDIGIQSAQLLRDDTWFIGWALMNAVTEITELAYKEGTK